MKKLAILVLFLISIAMVSAQEAMVWTDKDNYLPLETVLVSGIDYLPDNRNYYLFPEKYY